jgi:hypothetical protein
VEYRLAEFQAILRERHVDNHQGEGRMADFTPGNPQLSPETDAAVAGWMRSHGWKAGPARWEMDPELGFHVWQEDEPPVGRSHALWVAESMFRHLSAEELVNVLDSEGVAVEIQVNFKVRIQERGAGYRISTVPRRSGESRRLE